MANAQQEDFVRRRITELRLSKNISEHKMSLDLDKSGSYIRAYLDMTPAEFFAPLDDEDTTYRKVCEKLRTMNESDIEKINTFIGWIEK